jgi:hypothetical protein
VKDYGRLDLSQPVPRWPDRWGRWELDTERLVLRHEEGYELDLELFSSAAPMLNMIVQVHHKAFMSATDVGYLIAALDDIFGIQGSLVPSGQDRRIDDVAGFLRQRSAARRLLD